MNSNEGRSENANSSGSADDFVAAGADIGLPKMLARYPTFTPVTARQQFGVDFANHCTRFRPVVGTAYAPIDDPLFHENRQTLTINEHQESNISSQLANEFKKFIASLV
ncbi:MAG: hypothetical protein WA012_06825 [Rhodoferax sp.]|uniref:hypothetical protein n=1 Tax=Rhodoferax sp. TaxID=50421 RepID=UPI003BB5A0AC